MTESRDPLDERALLSCHDAIVRLAARLAFDPNLADDVAQQAMLQLLRAPPRAGPGLKAFLAKVVSNVGVNLRLADVRRSARERMVAPSEALPSTADVVVQLNVHKDVVDEVLRLDEPARTIVFLRFFRDEKPRAIAARLGEPVATIETRLRRALARLRDRLDERHGGDRAAWLAVAVPTMSAPHLANAALVAAAGGIVVGMKSMVVIAAAFVIACAGVWFAWSEHEVATVARTNEALEPATVVSNGSDRSKASQVGEPALPVRRLASNAGDLGERDMMLALRAYDGAIVADATVAVMRDGQLVAAGTTDARGMLHVAVDAGPVDVFVNWWKRPLTKVASTLPSSGTVDIVLPRGAVVAGHVVVDGRAPLEWVALDITFEPPLRFPDGLTAEARTALDVGGYYDDALALVTAADGRFEVAGLDPGVALRVRVGDSNRHRAEDARFARGFPFVAPYERAEIRLLESASIRGRIVDSSGEPVAHANVGIQFDTDAVGTSRNHMFASEDGAFVFWLGRSEGIPMTGLKHCVLEADAPGRGRVRTNLDGDLDHGRDLGAVRLDPPRTLRVRVTDDRQAPVDGARVFAALEQPSIAGPSAADGWIEVRALAVGDTLHVAAVGFECAPLVVPPSDVDTVDVVLTPATTLRVSVVDAQGDALPRMRVAIEADAPLWTSNGGFDIARIGELGDAFTSALLASGSSNPTYARIDVETDDAGEFVVRRIAADLPLRIAVDDPFVGVLAQRAVTLTRGREEHVQFSLAATPRSLRGRVVDRRGQAVAGALIVVGPRVVDVGTQPTADVRAETRLDGRFSMQTLWFERAAMWISRPGFGTTLLRDVAVPTDGAEQTFVVEDALVVTCRIVDVAGRPIAGAEVEAFPVLTGYETLGTFAWGDEIEPGVYEIGRLSSEPIRIRATIAGASFELEHDPAIELATLVVPELGAHDKR